ncbi:MAG: aldehyde dehydrogenase family protein, partial [Bacteroidia bacterium]|nr:aldehyde dehydrogenase family protein [Bacteroidia bacterium]
VAECIWKAAKSTGMPDGVFGHVFGASFEVGKALVTHPHTRAVGFTGSFGGGKALYDMANERPDPIPVFSEMGSTNPVFILPGALQKRSDKIADMYAVSITQSVGQFCTNPGILLGAKSSALNNFLETLGAKLREIAPAAMLHPGIASAYHKKRSEALSQPGVELIAESKVKAKEDEGQPSLATVDLEHFLTNEKLAEEVFGPYSILVQGNSVDELDKALEKIPGQLTATIIGEDDELVQYAAFIERVREKAGRLIFNGVPTGVEVCPAMQHGGPFPATTDSRFTSVGTDAIKRFVRPVAYQNAPAPLLPNELKDENPLGIWRLVDYEWTKERV